MVISNEMPRSIPPQSFFQLPYEMVPAYDSLDPLNEALVSNVVQISKTTGSVYYTELLTEYESLHRQINPSFSDPIPSDGLSIKEISNRLGLTREGVSSRLSSLRNVAKRDEMQNPTIVRALTPIKEGWANYYRAETLAMIALDGFIHGRRLFGIYNHLIACYPQFKDAVNYLYGYRSLKQLEAEWRLSHGPTQKRVFSYMENRGYKDRLGRIIFEGSNRQTYAIPCKIYKDLARTDPSSLPLSSSSPLQPGLTPAPPPVTRPTARTTLHPRRAGRQDPAEPNIRSHRSRIPEKELDLLKRLLDKELINRFRKLLNQKEPISLEEMVNLLDLPFDLDDWEVRILLHRLLLHSAIERYNSGEYEPFPFFVSTPPR